MLVLTRRIGEAIVIGDAIRITVVAVKGDRVRLGVSAPDDVRVDRQEVHERRLVEEGASSPRSNLISLPT